MSKALGTVATIAGAVVLIASGVGAAAGVGLALSASTVATAATIAKVATVVAAAASIGASATAKKPPAQGSVSNILIAANAAMPYVMGRTHVGGVLVHDVGYGPTIKDVPNPYRAMVFVYSGAGPVQEIQSFQSDFATIFSNPSTSAPPADASGYYNGFMWLDAQLGATPETHALAAKWPGMPNWGGSHKLSGYAAALVTLKFDKDGKKYASGVPQFGSIIKGVKVYDPRLDSTYPGGSGAHLFADETTWTYSENPALHALAYAKGRYHNGKKVFGCGFPADGIDIAAFVQWANICTANSWEIGGAIYEPGSRWDNLKRICAAGAAEPCFVGGKLSVRFNAPRVALDTITPDDLADGEYQVPAMKTYRERINAIVYRYRSESHKWEYVQGDEISVPSYVTEDGEKKVEERQYDLVQNKDQAAQLAAYELVNGRELGPIILPCKPRLMEYKPGEALELDLPELGLVNQLCVITGRRIDPATAIVELTLESETTAKHAFALGRTGTAPPTPTITSGEELDNIVGGVVTQEQAASAIAASFPQGIAGLVTVTTNGTVAEVTIPAHTRVYPTLARSVTVAQRVFSGLPLNTLHFFAYDDDSLDGVAPVWLSTTVVADGYYSASNPYRHHVARVLTPIADGTGGSSSGSGPPGSGGWSGSSIQQVP